jgi:hypothetical protein
LMGAQALSLAVESALHVSGTVRGHSGTEIDAGVAEAVICVALLWGTISLARGGATGWRIALGTTLFAVAGFCLGLTITVPSGYIPDIAYHATVLPILLGTVALIVRSRPLGDAQVAEHG